MQKTFLLLATACSLAVCAAQPGWQLVWQDEFDGAASSAPDSAKWAHDLGGGGWGNAELETYTKLPENIALDGNGNLIIRALKSSAGDITSARIKTEGKFALAYGRIEARMKVPKGQGMWTSFWMLGADVRSVGWPECGEIDIMENLGMEPTAVHGTLHGPGYNGAQSLGSGYLMPNGERLSDDFHVYGVTWTPEGIEFYIDSTVYARATPSSLPAGARWVFNKPFHLLLNLAVGGNWGGNPDSSTQFPQSLAVDYIRVYRNSTSPVINPGSINNVAFSPGTTLAPGSVLAIPGTGFASGTRSDLFTGQQYPTSADGTIVMINGVAAPIAYLSPSLIYAQIPWGTPTGSAIKVTVVRNGVPSNTETITLKPTAAAVFADSGVLSPNCYTGAVRRGATCTLIGTGFGARSPMPPDGGTAPQGGARVFSTCRLTIDGVPATVTYCGGAPGQLLDRVDFVYPGSVPVGAGQVRAVLQVGDQTETYQIIGPVQ